MVIFYLTNLTLDVSMGVAWWITKNTLIGIYNGSKYLIYGKEESLLDTTERESYDSNAKNDMNNQILEELKKLKEELKEFKKIK